MSNTQPFDYQKPTSTEDIKKILYWRASKVQITKTPSPKEFEERIYEVFLNSYAFKTEVRETEKLLYENPEKVLDWDE